MIKKLRLRIVEHGILSLGLVMLALFVMRGFDWGTFWGFGILPGIAFFHARFGKSRMAEAFLISVGLAALVSLFPQLFPRLGIRDGAATASHDERLMALYWGIYLVWFVVVLPIGLFGGSLRAKRRGEVPRFSSVTCYLGLFAASLLWMVALASLPGIIKGAGLSPVY